MHKLDIVAIISRIAGLSILASDATFASSINAIAGPYGPKIVAILGLVAVVATDIIRVIAVPTKDSTHV